VDGLRIGVHRDWFAAADRDVVAACDAVLAGLERAGARIVAIELPDPDLMRLAHLVVIVSEMAGARVTDPPDAAFGVDTRLSFALARGFASGDYVHALRLRHRLGTALRDVYERVDVVVTPTTACTAPPIRADALATGESDIPLLDRIMRFATPANLFGLPAISVPAGYDAGGLPIGIQAMGRPGEEDALLRFAAAVEARVEKRAPKVWFGPAL
jgi:Asp-tRNA(Asn)/Glu-tRNA(Gln) amidotransferase A subunit family amidase